MIVRNPACQFIGIVGIWYMKGGACLHQYYMPDADYVFQRSTAGEKTTLYRPSLNLPITTPTCEAPFLFHHQFVLWCSRGIYPQRYIPRCHTRQRLPNMRL